MYYSYWNVELAVVLDRPLKNSLGSHAIDQETNWFEVWNLRP
jgi:hypothetical protein